MSESINRSFGLDFARAFAISLVVLSHFGHKSTGSLGFWGVELFFALSGFLIGQILWRNFNVAQGWSFSKITNFWYRRWWRTLPNYYLFFIINLLFYHFNGDGLPSVNRLIDFVWFGQHLFSFYWGFYPVAWSLCVEEWFYLLFPIMLFIISKFNFERKLSFAITLGIFFVIPMAIRYALILLKHSDNLNNITIARLDSIASGVFVSFILNVLNPSLFWKRGVFGFGFFLTVTPIIFVYFTPEVFDYWIQNPILLLVVPLGFALMMPMISLLSPPRFATTTITNIVSKLSLWSYSIYLSHMIVMWVVYTLLKNFRSDVYVNLLSKIIGLIIAVIVSALLFEYFEKPFTRKRPSELRV